MAMPVGPRHYAELGNVLTCSELLMFAFAMILCQSRTQPRGRKESTRGMVAMRGLQADASRCVCAWEAAEQPSLLALPDAGRAVVLRGALSRALLVHRAAPAPQLGQTPSHAAVTLIPRSHEECCKIQQLGITAEVQQQVVKRFLDVEVIKKHSFCVKMQPKANT